LEAKANREDNKIKPSVLWKWLPQRIKKSVESNSQLSTIGSQRQYRRHYNQTINSQEIAAKANREVTQIKPLVFRHCQPNSIEKTL
jgi:hypothetical protein